MCRRVEGGTHRLVCTMSGWGLLWRTVLFALSCIVIVPIPWSFHWFMRWMVSQFALGDASQPAAAYVIAIPGSGQLFPAGE